MSVKEFSERLWIMACDLSISEYEIENFIRYHLRKNKFVVLSWEYFNLYCRASINDGSTLFTNVDRCSFNPNLDSIALQRCNYERQQVFYASIPMDSEVTCSATAQSEVSFEQLAKNHAIKWHYITLSQWKPERPLNLFVFPLAKRSIEQNRDFQKGLAEWSNEIRKLIPDKIEAEKYTSLLKYFSDVFCKDDNQKGNWYRISAPFYNCLMRFSREDSLNIDGVVYPSANTNSGGTNIVLNKELCVKVLNVFMFRQPYFCGI